MDEDIQQIEDESVFKELLESMGIDIYDPLVPTALADYARRLTTELLCDAKDYSKNANHSDINVDDIHLAHQLSDSILETHNSRSNQLIQISKEINSRPLRLPSNTITKLYNYNPESLHRSYTFIPGDEAYSKISTTISSNNSTANTKAQEIATNSSNTFQSLKLSQISTDRKQLKNSIEYFESAVDNNNNTDNNIMDTV